MSKATKRSAFVRNWVWLWLQDRRRDRAAPAIDPPAPVITNGWPTWDATEVGWVDNYLTITFDQGGLPVANFEIWERDTNHALHLLATIPSAALVDPYHHDHASQDEDTFYYKVRYRNGSVLGPFSDEFAIASGPLP